MYSKAMCWLRDLLKHCKWLRITLVVLGLIVLAAVLSWYKLCREVDQPEMANAEEGFKYGSIGSERN